MLCPSQSPTALWSQALGLRGRGGLPFEFQSLSNFPPYTVHPSPSFLQHRARPKGRTSLSMTSRLSQPLHFNLSNQSAMAPSRSNYQCYEVSFYSSPVSASLVQYVWVRSFNVPSSWEERGLSVWKGTYIRLDLLIWVHAKKELWLTPLSPPDKQLALGPTINVREHQRIQAQEGSHTKSSRIGFFSRIAPRLSCL